MHMCYLVCPSRKREHKNTMHGYRCSTALMQHAVKIEEQATEIPSYCESSGESLVGFYENKKVELLTFPCRELIQHSLHS